MTAAAVGAVLLPIPLMVWAVARAKRKAPGFALAYALFFGLERMGDQPTDAVQQAQDPEGVQKPGSGKPIE
ncbi:MAG: hypothetical protein AB7E79_11305 [Rhodospirillaceae bacterium]